MNTGTPQTKVKSLIKDFLSGLDDAKRAEVKSIHDMILHAHPKVQLWFDDGVDNKGKAVTNPNIGYGHQTLRYANGSSREFFRIGLSANKSGVSVYILGLADKTALSKLFASRLGKAKVTGYCINFKKLPDIDSNVLAEAVAYGLEQGE